MPDLCPECGVAHPTGAPCPTTWDQVGSETRNRMIRETHELVQMRFGAPANYGEICGMVLSAMVKGFEMGSES